MADDFDAAPRARSRLLEKRKIGISGSSKDVSETMARFSRAVGHCLGESENTCIVTGGTKYRSNASDLAVDWLVAEAAEGALKERRADVEAHLATVPRDESSSSVGFRKGRAWHVRGKTSEARRFAFVRRLDGLIAIGGGDGTDQELALAFELGIPTLPVPSFLGRSKDGNPAGARKYWDAYRHELVRWLGLDDAEAARWETLDNTDVDSLARAMTERFLESLARRCFVITPFTGHSRLFEEVIAPAVDGVGDTVVNLQHLGLVGDAAGHVTNGIANCDYVIAVLDDLNLNVMYELGLAHGQTKPAVLISRPAATLGKNLPFDIVTHNRLEYEVIDETLRDRLIDILKHTLTQR